MKKCLVLDLDNTLWGGILGEDGPDGIKLGFDPAGASFLAFQQAVLDLHNRGIILAINSKNNYEDAMHLIRTHPNMVLKENNFVAVRINWSDKVSNMREIARELNIGLDSFVFLDDDPFNRSTIRACLPEVETPEFPSNPEKYANFLIELESFQGGGTITDEDKMRGNLYVTERLRKATEKNFLSTEDFLRSLEITVNFYQNDRGNLARLAQLTEKTNQFNMNKIPMTESEIINHVDDHTKLVVYTSARDRFGDYGIIGLALVNKTSDVWLINSMLMSCRALGRGIEEAFLEGLAGKARKNSAKKLRVEFTKTEKNQPAEDFLKKYFLPDYHYDLSKTSIMPSWVKASWKN